jgi:O-antigen/teichoic acid export membrane protein
MRFLYAGKDYEGHGQTVAVLGLATFVSAIGMPASNALAAMERPRAIVAVSALAAAVTVGLVWWLMTGWGLSGAAYGVLAGNVVGSVGLWVGFRALVRRPADGAPAVLAGTA